MTASRRKETKGLNVAYRGGGLYAPLAARGSRALDQERSEVEVYSPCKVAGADAFPLFTVRLTPTKGFYNPVNTSFNIPVSAGQSYSFTDDGYWEQSLYMYTANPSRPSCVSASLFWQHGTWTHNGNNSLTLTPFNGDGRQLIEDRCSSTSTMSSYYYQPEYMLGFDITLDLHFGRPEYRLQLYAFDGALKPLMWQTHNPPQMLPTELLVETIYGSTS